MFLARQRLIAVKHRKTLGQTIFDLCHDGSYTGGYWQAYRCEGTPHQLAASHRPSPVVEQAMLGPYPVYQFQQVALGSCPSHASQGLRQEPAQVIRHLPQGTLPASNSLLHDVKIFGCFHLEQYLF